VTQRQRVFDLLGVRPGAPVEEIRRAYRRYVMAWHPDRLNRAAPEIRAEATACLQEINAAYGVLTLPPPRRPRPRRREPAPAGPEGARRRRSRWSAARLWGVSRPLFVVMLALAVLEAALVLAVLLE
jgi:curved DNA-binding protein CbpA